MKNKLFTVAFICLLTVIANIGYNTATYWLTEQNDKADLVTDSVPTADTATSIILDSIALAPCPTTIDPQMYFNGTWFHVVECNQFDEKGNLIKEQEHDAKGNLKSSYIFPVGIRKVIQPNLGVDKIHNTKHECTRYLGTY